MDPWKLGIFYFDRADPRLLVPKATGLGMTLNFGHPMAWVITALLVALLVLLQIQRRKGK